MAPADYWDGWYAYLSVAGVVGYIVVSAGVFTGVSVYHWWKGA